MIYSFHFSLYEVQSIIEQLKNEIGNLKDIEKSKSQSENRFRQLLESVTDYIYTVKIVQGEPISTVHNSGCFTVTGYSSDDYAHNPKLWYQMIYESDRQTVQDFLSNIFAGKSSLPIEHRIVHKNGSIRWIKHTIVPDFDDNGELIAYDGLINDITENKITSTINATRLHLIQYADNHSFGDILYEILIEAEKLTNSKNSFYIFIKENGERFSVKNF